ncbi:NAD(P)/FAD-dependent oxidoreductase [Candidatus Binatus sp.]|uniref:NAD(P)/FAD-dependent oxidoreductase n=1 Tax=Candidatus Binatus sp. TaxID=2811406 RepID=UPI003C742E13
MAEKVTQTSSSSANIIVIGAGVVGCSVAFHLARAGARVHVFDKGGICAGMSARSGALVRMHYTFAPEAELAWKSHHYFRNWSDIVGGRCGFVETGFAVVVDERNATRLRANVAMLRGVGVDTEVVTAAELHRREPHASVDDVALAAFEPHSGYADPVATTESLAAAAKRYGAEFSIDTPVARIASRGGHASGVVDAVGRIHEADAVCIVAGPWTDALLAPLSAKIGIRSERAQIAFFKRPSQIKHCIYIDTIAGSYFRPHGDDLTLAGLGGWKSEAEANPDDFREANNDDFVAAVRTRLARRIPAMADAPYSRGHAGIYDVSPDARAVMGAVPTVERLFVAAGFSGTGFKTAPAVGASMAELILTGASSTVDLTPFGFERILRGRMIESPHEYEMGADFGHKL